MTRSLALWLAALRARGPDRAAPIDRPAPPAGSGPLLWVNASEGTSAAALHELIERMLRMRDDMRILLTPEPGLMRRSESALPEEAVIAAQPAESRAAVEAFLETYRPDAALFLGGALPPVTLHMAGQAGLPMLLAEAVMDDATRRGFRFRRAMATALLENFTQILARDGDSARHLRALSSREQTVEIAGPVEPMCPPPPCNEAEREALALLLRARPVWLAACCPEGEEAAVLAAHGRATQHAHRMLLILMPSDPARGPALAEEARQMGWDVALRSEEEEPDPTVQVYIADTGEAELGLWYRLAPVTYMGGTMTGAACPVAEARSPFEPAGLGSAILCGTRPANEAATYDRLLAADAARRVDCAEDLAIALVDLIAADRAAILAHNAWALASGGAGVAERVARAAVELLPHPARSRSPDEAA